MPGVIPVSILRPFRSSPAPDLQQFGQKVLSSRTVFTSIQTVLALILEDRISWCLSLGKGFLGLGFSFWDHPCPLLPPSENGLVPSFSFVLLPSPAEQGLAWSQHFWTPCPAAVQQWHWGQLVAMIRLLLPSLTAAGVWVIKTGSSSSFFLSSARWEPPAAIRCCFSPFLWEFWIPRMTAASGVSYWMMAASVSLSTS